MGCKNWGKKSWRDAGEGIQGNLQRPLHSLASPTWQCCCNGAMEGPPLSPSTCWIPEAKTSSARFCLARALLLATYHPKLSFSFLQKPHLWRLPHDQDSVWQTTVWYSQANLRKASSGLKCYSKMHVWIEVEPKCYYLEKRKSWTRAQIENK